MSRVNAFTFRINAEERRLLAALANRLQRSQSDTVRLLIREAAKELVTSDGKTKTQHQAWEVTK
jgi:hypothetical protein